MKPYIFTFILCAFFLSCTRHQETIVKFTSKIQEIQEYSEDQFVVNVSDIITVDQNTTFIIDQGISKLIKTTPKLKTFEVIGNRGMGPKEMMSPSIAVSSSNGYIYIFDQQKMKLLSYSKKEGSITDEIPLNQPLMNQALAIKDSVLLFTSPIDQEIDIKRFDLKNKKLLTGISLNKESAKSFFGKSIFLFNDGYVTVKNFDTPIIETYDKDWNLESTLNLSENDLIKHFLEFDTKDGLKTNAPKSSKKASAKIVVRAAKANQNSLYLLIYSVNGQSEVKSNIILEFNYTDHHWNHVRNIQLPEEGSYQTFSFTPDQSKIIAFEKTNGVLELLEINE